MIISINRSPGSKVQAEGSSNIFGPYYRTVQLFSQGVTNHKPIERMVLQTFTQDTFVISIIQLTKPSQKITEPLGEVTNEPDCLLDLGHFPRYFPVRYTQPCLDLLLQIGSQVWRFQVFDQVQLATIFQQRT
jgi:hypothetical protein